MNTNLTQITIWNTFIKSGTLTQLLTPPKNHVNIFENQKMNAATQTPKQHITFYQYTSSTKYLYFLVWGTDPFPHPYPKFSALPNLNFLAQEPKNLYFKSFPAHYPQPTLNQICPKYPELILILTMKLLCTYFSLTLPEVICLGHSVWVTQIELP